MYSREFTKAPNHLIKNGKARFGTYDDVPEKIDIKGMRAPYAGLPLPTFISKIRIKSRLDYVFSNEEFLGLAEFFDFKIFGLVELIFWNKATGRKYAYHTFTTTRKRLVPKSTGKGICASYQKKRSIKVAWGRNHSHMSFKFDVKGDSVKPSAKGSFFAPSDLPMHSDALFVCPAPTSSRCSATWISTMNVQGSVSINGEAAASSEGLAIFTTNRTYYRTSSSNTLIWGLGTVRGKSVALQLGTSTYDAVDPDKYNSNILVVDGKKTALPPVDITNPFTDDGNWIIQDTESMVDLTFTPSSKNGKHFNIIAFRAVGTKIYGTFEGTLLTAEGEKISFKNLPGIINRNHIRL